PSVSSLRLTVTASAPTGLPSPSLHDALPIGAEKSVPARACSSAVRQASSTPGRNSWANIAWVRSDASASRTDPSGGGTRVPPPLGRSEEHTSELQSRFDLVCRLLLEKKKKRNRHNQRDESRTTNIVHRDHTTERAR